MRTVALLLLAAAFALTAAPASAGKPVAFVRINVTNGTGYYIYIDASRGGSENHHVGLFAPMSKATVDRSDALPFFLTLYVYVKTNASGQGYLTICRTLKTFRSTKNENTVLEEHVHYNETTRACSIDKA